MQKPAAPPVFRKAPEQFLFPMLRGGLLAGILPLFRHSLGFFPGLELCIEVAGGNHLAASVERRAYFDAQFYHFGIAGKRAAVL